MSDKITVLIFNKIGNIFWIGIHKMKAGRKCRISRIVLDGY